MSGLVGRPMAEAVAALNALKSILDGESALRMSLGLSSPSSLQYCMTLSKFFAVVSNHRDVSFHSLVLPSSLHHHWPIALNAQRSSS